MQETIDTGNVMKNIFSAAMARLKKEVPENGEILLSYAELRQLGYDPSQGTDFDELRDMAYVRNNEFGFLSQAIVFSDIMDVPAKSAMLFKFTRPFMDAVIVKLPPQH